jgi:ACS family hexuronate transporter-like MFS transporter
MFRSLRWPICGLLVLLLASQAVDRQIVSVLAPILKRELGWDKAQFGWIDFAYSAGFAVMFVFGGRLLDRFGVKFGMACAALAGSVTCAIHSVANSWVGFAGARFALGLAVAAYLPGCIKCVAEWFPIRERTLATGIFGLGVNLGVMCGPLFPGLVFAIGWRATFVVAGSIGLPWIAAWMLVFRSRERRRDLPPPELPPLPRADRSSLPWLSLLRHRQTWALVLGKMISEFGTQTTIWLPAYIASRGGSPTESSALAYSIIAGMVGAVGGGWLPGHFMKRGWPPGRARFAVLSLFAAFTPIACFAPYASDVAAVTLLCICSAASSAWSTNMLTVPSDWFPKSVLGTAVGLQGLIAPLVGIVNIGQGLLLQSTKSWVPIFVVAGVAHPLATLTMIALGGIRMKEVDVFATSAAASPSSVGAGRVADAAGG